MGIRNTTDGWGWPARLLHWGMAGVILFMLGLGIWISQFPENDLKKFEPVQLHKSWGALAFALAVLRVAWRAVNRSPALPATMPRWQVAASHGSHLALYVLILAIPLTGWLMVSASPLQDIGVRNMVFGLFEMPDPFSPGSASLSGWFHDIHTVLAWLLVAVLGLHVAAALKHAAIDRDTILRRMIMGR